MKVTPAPTIFTPNATWIASWSNYIPACFGTGKYIFSITRVYWNSLVQAQVLVPAYYYFAKNNNGSTVVLFKITLQCKCAPVTRPVNPTLPIMSPVFT